MAVKFDYIIGNPPYQGDKGNAKLYPYFYVSALSLGKCVELIFPSAWQEPKNTNGLQLMNNSNIKQDKQIVFIDNRHNVFPSVSGAEWTNVVMWKKDYDNGLGGSQRVLVDGQNETIRKLLIDTKDVVKPMELRALFDLVKDCGNFKSIKTIMSVAKPYGLRTDIMDNTEKYGLAPMTNVRLSDSDLRLICKNNVFRYMPYNYCLPKKTVAINKYKVFLPNAWGNLSKNYLGGAYADIMIAQPGDICSETFLESGCFDSYALAYKHAKYLLTKFCRSLLYLNKYSLLCVTAWDAVPLQDYHEDFWNETIETIDIALMDKYHVPQHIRDFVFSHIQTKTEKNIVYLVE